MPQGGWPYRHFDSNYARFAAGEILKQRDREGFTKPGFLLQVIAAGWHHKSADQLREIGDKVGRERILVLHGTHDRIISVPHGRKLIEYLQPGQSLVVDGMGRKSSLALFHCASRRFRSLLALPTSKKYHTINSKSATDSSGLQMRP
jgi:hypothetical protein